MKLSILALSACLFAGCAHTPTFQEKIDAEADKCTQIRNEKGEREGRQCMLVLHAKLGIPVKCTYLSFEGKQDEADRCLAEARESQRLAYEQGQRQREQYDYEHRGEAAERVGNSWNAFGAALSNSNSRSPSQDATPSGTHAERTSFGTYIQVPNK